MKKRYFGMDVVRILALCLLYWLHFFLRNGFYSKPVDNPVMIVAVSGRIIFMCCVPLFLMITGYLKCGKEWSRDYYFSLLPILISWVFDQKIFSWQKGYPAGEYWWRGLAATGLVFLLSFLSGWCIHQISVRMNSLIQNRMNK